MWGPRTLQGWATGCMWVGTRQPLLAGLWGGHGKGPHRPLLGSEARPRRHFSQDLPALQSSLNACSAMLRASRPPLSGPGGRRASCELDPCEDGGRPATCLPALAPPASLGAAAWPPAESQPCSEQGARGAGASGKGAARTPETGRACGDAARTPEASFLGRAPAPEKGAGGNPGKAAARSRRHTARSGSVPSGTFQPGGCKPANAEK